MKRRLVVGLTLLLFLSLGTFITTIVINDRSNLAFEDLHLTDRVSPTGVGTGGGGGGAPPPCTPTPNPSITPFTSPTVQKNGVNGGPGTNSSNSLTSPTPGSSPSPTATTSPSPCTPTPSPSTTPTVISTVTAGVTITPTANGSSTPRPSPSPTTSPSPSPSPTKTRTPTPSPTPCPTVRPNSNNGSGSDDCSILTIRLRYRIPQVNGNGSDRNPYQIVYEESKRFVVSGKADSGTQQLWAVFFCGNPNSPKGTSDPKPINVKGEASVDLKKEIPDCPKEEVQARINGYLDAGVGGLPIPGTKADPIHFGDYSYKDDNHVLKEYKGFDQSNMGVNYLDEYGYAHINPITARIWDGSRKPNNILEVVGVRPAVGGTFSRTISGNAKENWLFCYLPDISKLIIPGNGLTWGNFTCDPTKHNVRKSITDPSFYLFSSNTGSMANDTISMGDYVRLHNSDPDGGRDFRITAIKYSGNIEDIRSADKWLPFSTFVDNEGKDKNGDVPQLIGFKRGVSNPDKPSYVGNRRDCNCVDKTKDIIANARAYVYGGRQLHHPSFSACSYFVTTVLKNAGIFSRVEPSCINLNQILYSAAGKGVLQQITPTLPAQWASYSRANIDQKELGLTPSDVIVFTDNPNGGGNNHAVIYAGKYNGKNTIVHSSSIGNSAIKRGTGLSWWIAHTYMSGARPVGGEYTYWSVFSFSCWDGTVLRPN